MKNFVLFLSVLVITSISLSASAKGDIAAGKAKAVMCSACHGVDGNSPIPIYPSLAGQGVHYLNKQLHDFKEAALTQGKTGRQDPIMAGMVMGLSDQDMEDVSAFFASQTPAVAQRTSVNELGKQLYLNGDKERGIAACSACHGADGLGVPLAGFPMVAGQHSDYIKSQLIKFKNSSRNNDPNGMMADVSKKLTDEDINALAEYMSGLQPPAEAEK